MEMISIQILYGIDALWLFGKVNAGAGTTQRSGIILLNVYLTAYNSQSKYKLNSFL